MVRVLRDTCVVYQCQHYSELNWLKQWVIA